MAKNSAIEWTDHTFNPWVGCSKVSPACDHCYAEGWAKRSGMVTWGQERRRTSAHNWNEPRRWQRAAAEAGIRARVFCASLADVFDNQVPDAWRADLFRLIYETPNLDWLLLTKRIGNARAMIDAASKASGAAFWPWPNVWIGATVVTQEEADRDVPKLLQVSARGRFLSIEPMLGPVDLERGGWSFLRALNRPPNNVNGWDRGVDWVIVGGESGPGARPMHPGWARQVRDQCAAAGVPFLFKQWGEWAPPLPADDDIPAAALEGRLYRVGKKAAGRALDGETWDQLPTFGVDDGNQQTRYAP